MRSNHRVLILVVLHFFLFPATLSPAALDGPAGKNRNRGTAVVYLLDSSTSMSWIYDQVKATLKGVIKDSKPEDSIAIFLFGEKVTTLASYTSLDESKKQTLYGLIDSASPDSLYTCFCPAVERGIEYLHDYYRTGVAEKYVLVFITDGKDHPPPDFVNENSLEEVMLRYPDFLPGKSWTLYYLALKGQVDPALLALVNKYDGKFYNTDQLSDLFGVSEEKVVQSIIEQPEYWKELSALIADHFGRVDVLRKGESRWSEVVEGARSRLFSGDQVALGEGSTALIQFGAVAEVGLRENTNLQLKKLESHPLKQKTDVQLELQQGTVWNMVHKPAGQSISYEVLTPIALTGTRGTDFRIFYDSHLKEETVSVFKGSVQVGSPEAKSGFKAIRIDEGTQSTIAAGKEPTAPSPIPSELQQEWEKWKKIILTRIPLKQTHFKPVKITPLLEQVVLGPIRSNAKYSAQVPLQFDERYRGTAAVTVETLISLPPGAAVTTEVKDDLKDPLRKNIEVLLACEPFLRYIGTEKFIGHMNLRSQDSNIAFSRHDIELQVLQNRPGAVERMRDLPSLLKIALTGLLALSVFAGTSITWKNRAHIRKWKNILLNRIRDMLVRTRLVNFYQGRPVGHLVLKSKMVAEGRARFDLAEISRRRNRITLCVGRDPASDLCFHHPSLLPLHCTLYAGRKRNPTDVYIKPCSAGHVTVNGKLIKAATQLQNRDEIEIGAVRFQFVDIQSQRQVIVHMNDGIQHIGVLEYWDLNTQIFYLSKIKAATEEFLTLEFEDVSHIEFYRDESEVAKNILPHPLRKSRKTRKIITVFLNNKTKLHGYVDRKYRHKRGTDIFLLPQKSEKIAYIYVPRTSIKSVVIVDAEKHL